MTPTGRLPVLVVRHVTWEGPHRILHAFDGRPVHLVDTLSAGAALPPVDTVAGAVFMGGPMSANGTDPLLGALAPRRTFLHWHGEILDPPSGSAVLARSAQTACQAFRVGSAWGMLFHPEADRELLDEWLAEPSMAAEAEQAHGPAAAHRLRADADAAEPELLAAADAMFAAFATRITAHADRYVAGPTA
ncbi:GMP synthase [Planomonospora sphaerica]|uniref:GMP synthase n=1 Tax=Planomonospora sphaerica TaxID=161355 RepID=A0A161LZ72_9ACTN|nr:hypothetical protein [Planomonospora sphaerica]GAT71309.1 GMP synthase [Planomonospora sphaerica]